MKGQGCAQASGLRSSSRHPKNKASRSQWMTKLGGEEDVSLAEEGFAFTTYQTSFFKTSKKISPRGDEEE